MSEDGPRKIPPESGKPHKTSLFVADPGHHSAFSRRFSWALTYERCGWLSLLLYSWAPESPRRVPSWRKQFKPPLALGASS